MPSVARMNFALAFAVAGLGLPGNVLPEMAVQMGEVPLVPYATPGTDALPEATTRKSSSDSSRTRRRI